MTFSTVMIMEGDVKSIKTVVIGAGTSKRDERLQTLNVSLTIWVSGNANTPGVVKGRPGYTKFS